MCLIGSRSSANRKNWGCDCDRHRQETGKIPVLLWPMCIYIYACVYIYIHQQGLMLEPHSKNNAFNVNPSSNVIVWGVNLKFSQLQVWDLTIRKPCSYKLVYNPIHLYYIYISAKTCFTPESCELSPGFNCC